MMAVSNFSCRSLGTFERHLAGARVELPLVVAGPRVAALCASLVALGADELVGLGVEQAVQGLFDRAADELREVPTHLGLVDLDDVIEFRRIFTHGVGSFPWF